MSKLARRTVLVVAVVLGGVMAIVSPASAETLWLGGYPINSGENVFLTSPWVDQTSGQSVGAAATCAGLRGISGSDRCGAEGAKVWSTYSLQPHEGYIHNHSTWKSWFNAWYN
jgi:hypothetical protein